MTSRRASRRERVVIIGDGIVATPSGRYDDVRPMAQLPKKVPGKHRWVALACFVVSDNIARTAMDAETLKYLDHEALYMFTLGCFDCEEALSQVGWDSSCPAAGDDD